MCTTVRQRRGAARGGGHGGPGMAGGGSYYVSVMGQEQGPVNAQQLQQMALAKQLDANTMVRAERVVRRVGAA